MILFRNCDVVMLQWKLCEGLKHENGLQKIRRWVFENPAFAFRRWTVRISTTDAVHWGLSSRSYRSWRWSTTMTGCGTSRIQTFLRGTKASRSRDQRLRTTACLDRLTLVSEPQNDLDVFVMDFARGSLLIIMLFVAIEIGVGRFEVSRMWFHLEIVVISGLKPLPDFHFDFDF